MKPHIVKNSTKTSVPTSGTEVKYNETITYTITVQNDGTEGQEVVIRDPIPENSTYVSVRNGGTTKKDQNGKVTEVQWIKTVPANGSVSVSFTVKVVGDANDKIDNVAYVDEEETTKTTHPIVKEIEVNASNNPGKNIVLVLDLSSSMLKVPTKGLAKNQYYYESEYGKGLQYVYAKDLPGSVERPESNLAKAKIALKDFAQKVLKNNKNKITLISFNYSSYNNAKAAMKAEPDWYYSTRYTDLAAHREIHPYVGVHTLVETTSYAEFKSAVDGIKIRAEYLLTDMVAGIEAAESKVKALKKEGKDIDVIFFGDGKPSLSTETGAKVDFHDLSTTYRKLELAGESIRSKGANLYTLEYLVTEDASKTAIAKTAFKKMTGGVVSQDNQIRFGANTSNVTNKLANIANIIDAPIYETCKTNRNGVATITIPTSLELRISDSAKVTLYIDGKIAGSYSSVQQINDGGKITYQNGKFIIDTTKYSAGSTIQLNYYYRKTK